MSQVQEIYEDDEFESLLDDAERNAANDWEETFVSDLRNCLAECNGHPSPTKNGCWTVMAAGKLFANLEIGIGTSRVNHERTSYFILFAHGSSDSGWEENTDQESHKRKVDARRRCPRQ